MRVLDNLMLALLPGPGNSYRPLMLRKEALAFFMAVVLAVEGLYVASLFGVNPSQVFLAAVAEAPAATTPSSVQSAQLLLAQSARTAGDPRTAATWALGAVAIVLAVILVLTVVVHVHIQPFHLILPGAAILLLALFFLWSNAVYAPSGPGDRGLAAPTPAQYHW